MGRYFTVGFNPFMGMFCRFFVKCIRKIREINIVIHNYYYLSLFKFHGERCRIEYGFSFLGLQNVSIGDDFRAGPFFLMRAFSTYGGQIFSPEIKIGNFFYCGRNCYISSIQNIRIGNNVTLASRVTIIDHNHGLNDFKDIEIPVLRRRLSSPGPITIEDNVWLAENVVVLGGIKIGKNSIIGAGAVVTHNIPANSIAVGNPAKVIRTIDIAK